MLAEHDNRTYPPEERAGGKRDRKRAAAAAAAGPPLASFELAELGAAAELVKAEVAFVRQVRSAQPRCRRGVTACSAAAQRDRD
jgi:hypothetical protein